MCLYILNLYSLLYIINWIENGKWIYGWKGVRIWKSKWMFIYFFKEFIWFIFREYEKFNLYGFIVIEGNIEMAGLF